MLSTQNVFHGLETPSQSVKCRRVEVHLLFHMRSGKVK